MSHQQPIQVTAEPVHSHLHFVVHFTYQVPPLAVPKERRLCLKPRGTNEWTDGRTDESVSVLAGQFALNARHKSGTRASVCVPVCADSIRHVRSSEAVCAFAIERQRDT